MAILVRHNDWFVRTIPEDIMADVDNYIFTLPSYGQNNFYRHTVSFTYFFQGANRKNFDDKTKTLYHASDPHYFDTGSGWIHGEKLPIRVPDIYALYEVIGYSRQKRRWLKLSERGLVAP